MAPETIISLRKRAIGAGMDFEDALDANRAGLEKFLNGSGDAKSAKRVVKKAVAKKKGRTAPAKKAPARKAAVRKSATRKPATRKAAPRRASRNSNGNGDAGRAKIGKVDYTVESPDWKPRNGSPVGVIWKALKRSRDDVNKAFDLLKPEMKNLVHSTKNNGDKRSREEMEATLKYRINRTRFEYAVRTGQHESSTNRVEYGTGDYAQAKKPARGRPRKAQSAPAKATRKPAAKRTATRKAAPARRSGAAARKKSASRR